MRTYKAEGELWKENRMDTETSKMGQQVDAEMACRRW
jgi:hypothetical protein